jgi:RNA recognition motif-containing protein
VRLITFFPIEQQLTTQRYRFAYVDFSSKDAKVIAITMSEGHLEGRKLLIKDGQSRPLSLHVPTSFTHVFIVTGDDFAGRPAEHASADRPEGTTNTKFAKRVLGTQKQPPAPTLFLGNLSFETTEASIRQMFDAHRRPAKEKGKDEASTAAAGETKQAGDTKATKEDWIRKVRLGTFEDSGLCKGWAFVDFATIAAATAALTNPHNYALDGRELKVEYASAEAVRRGAAKGSAAGTKPKERKEFGKALGKGKYDRETRIAAKVAKQTGEVMPQEDPVERPAKRQKAGDQDEDVSRSGKGDKRKRTDPSIGRPAQEKAKVQEMRRGKDGRMRPAPGAALAMAKRESTSIVPSQGTKIKF